LENYSTIGEFCHTTEYQTWQNQWQPPVNDVIWFNERHDLQKLLVWNTPREYHWNRTASRIPYYLLDSINIDTEKCVDIGCGDNFLSWHNSHIWGVDTHSPKQHEELTSTWYADNSEKWSKVISINAIHFCPVQKIGESLSKIESILTSGGSGVVAINRARIKELSNLSTGTYTDEVLIEQIRTISSVTRIVWLDEPKDSPLDGNVWVWINK
jgi:hypothetical protein